MIAIESYPDSKQCQPRSGTHLASMDYTRARCGLDLGQNYLAVWVGVGLRRCPDILSYPSDFTLLRMRASISHPFSHAEQQYLMYLHYCKGRFMVGVGVDVNKTQSNR